MGELRKNLHGKYFLKYVIPISGDTGMIRGEDKNSLGTMGGGTV